MHLKLTKYTSLDDSTRPLQIKEEDWKTLMQILAIRMMMSPPTWFR